MFTSTAAIFGTAAISVVPAGGIVLPIDPVLTWSLLLGCLVASTAAFILGRADTSLQPKRQSGPKPWHFDKAA